MQNPHVYRPYREKVLASQNNDGAAVVRDVVLGPCATPVLYNKHMAKQIVGLDKAFLEECENVILVRDPIHLLSSWSEKLEPSLEETSLPELVQLYSHLRRAVPMYSLHTLAAHFCLF